MDIINLDDKRIKSLDSILKKCLENPNGPINIMPSSKEEREFMHTSLYELKQCGYIKQNINNPDGSFSVAITEKGKSFLEGGSYYERKEKKAKEIKNDKLYKQLNIIIPFITAIIGAVAGVLFDRFLLR